MRESNTIDVLADDFTGAMDAGVQFARAGLDTALVLRAGWREATQVQVISSNSRDVDPRTARCRLQQALRLLRSGPVFKKIDSTMRGYIGMEVEATLEATGLRKAVVCPALIEQGRLVHDGRLYVGEQLLIESAFAHDPTWPATSSEMRDLVGMPSTHVGLEAVREGSSSLARAIAAAPTRAVTLDATTSSDLVTIGQAALLGNYLPCGSLGLAEAWAAGIAGSRPAQGRRLPHSDGPVLIVAGSRHPSTVAQVSRLLRERDLTEIMLSPGVPAEAESLRAVLANGLASGRSAVLRFPDERIGAEAAGRLVSEILCDMNGMWRNVRLGGLAIVGGETAGWVCQALAIEAVRLMGEVLVGIPWGRMVGGHADGLLVVTKAGGFGDDRALVAVHDALRQPAITGMER